MKRTDRASTSKPKRKSAPKNTKKKKNDSGTASTPSSKKMPPPKSNPKKSVVASKLGSEYMALEEQYIIKFPLETAKKVRKMIKSDKMDKMTLLFKQDNATGSRYGALTLENGEEYRVVLTDLPCVLETHKTLDKRNYYKSGDIGQMLIVQDQNDIANPSQPYDDKFHCSTGLTPGTKNIRKRKWRKRPEISTQEIKDSEAEIIRHQKGGVYTDRADIELIPVEDVDEIFETPSGNMIITMKDGPPIRAGIPSTFQDSELLLLPKHQRERLKNSAPLEEELDELEDELLEEDDLEDLGGDHDITAGVGGEDKKKKESILSNADPLSPPSPPDGDDQDTAVASGTTDNSEKQRQTKGDTEGGSAVSETEESSRAPNDAEQAKIRELRTQKVNIANEIAQLQRKNEQSRIILKDEQNEKMLKRIMDRINKFNQLITSKKKLMSNLDAELAKYGTV